MPYLLHIWANSPFFQPCRRPLRTRLVLFNDGKQLGVDLQAEADRLPLLLVQPGPLLVGLAGRLGPIGQPLPLFDDGGLAAVEGVDGGRKGRRG